LSQYRRKRERLVLSRKQLSRVFNTSIRENPFCVLIEAEDFNENWSGCIKFMNNIIFINFIVLFTILNPSLKLGTNVNFQSKAEPIIKLEEKHAIVSGQSIVGMLAAAVLAKSGYIVDCFEIRDEYTRNIQWAVRQSLVDELASIDKKLADSFIKKIARPIYKGSTHVYVNGYRRNKSHKGLEKGIASRLPSTCHEMMAKPSIAIVEAKAFEIFLKKYLQSLPNIHLHQELFTEWQQTIDLIVIAEGFNSKTRNKLNIQLIASAQNKPQIAGALYMDSGGIMLKHWRNENGRIRLTGVMGRAGSGSTWIVADVDNDKIKTQNDLNVEFRRLAADALDLPIKTVEELKISGPVGDGPVTSFILKQAICETATHGDNIILIGDAVGAGHWSVGGGMQTGSVCHIERLKTLLANIKEGMPKAVALNEYSDAVIRDTKTWIEVSTNDQLHNMH